VSDHLVKQLQTMHKNAVIKLKMLQFDSESLKWM